MSSVDERVVQMKFDNAQFEAGVQTTLESLNKLKTSLDDNTSATTFDSITKAANNVSLSGIQDSLDSLSNRFSIAGIAGMTFVSELTKSFMGLGTTIKQNLIDPIVSGGWNRASNIEKAKFQIEGLGKSWDDLYGDIDYAVSGTAYGLDSAAMAAGQLTASGVSAGENMKNSLRGISGVAAMTGSSYDDVARIFTQVAGNGRLMGEQLLEISSRGINAAKALADYIGTDEATVRQMVSKGQIDFQTFANAMDSAFGQHAKDANKTFSGAMDNVHAAMAKIGADFESTLISSKDYNEYMTKGSTDGYANLISIANAYREALNGLRTALHPVEKDFTTAFHGIADAITKGLNGIIDQNVLAQSLQNNGSAVYQFTEPIQEAFTNLYNGFKNISDFILSVGTAVGQAWADIFPPVTVQTIDNITASFEKLTEMLPKYDDLVSEVSNTFGVDLSGAAQTSVQAVGDATDATAALGTVSGVVGKTIDKVSDSIFSAGKSASSGQIFFENLSDTFSGVFAVADAVGKAFGYIAKIVSTFVLPVIGGLAEIFVSVTGLIGSWVGAIDKGIPTVDDFSSGVDALANFLKPLGDALCTVKDFIVGFFDALKPTGAVITTLVTVFKMLAGAIGGFVSSIDLPGIGNLGTFFATVFGGIVTVLQDAWSVITGKLGDVGKAISDFFSQIQISNDPAKVISDAFSSLQKSIYNGINSIKLPNGNGLLDSLQAMFKPVVDFLSTIGKTIGEYAGNVIKSISDFMNGAVDATSGNPLLIVAGAFSEGFSMLTQAFSDFKLPDLSDILSALDDFLTHLLKSLGDIGKGIGNFLDDVFKPKIAEAKSLTEDTKPDTKTNIQTPLEKFVDWLKGIGDGLSSGFKVIEDAISGFEDFLIGQADKLAGVLEKYVALFVGFEFGALLKNASGLLKNFSGLIKSFTNISENLSRFNVADFLGVGDAVRAFQKKLKSESIKNVAIAIGILAASLAVLAFIPADQLVKAAGALAVAAATLVVASKLLSKVDVGSMQSIGIGMFALAAGVGILVIAVKALSKMDPNALQQGLSAVGTLLIDLGGMMAVISIATTNTVKVAGSLIALSIGVLILTKAIGQLSKMDPDALKQGLDAVIMVLLGIAAAVSVINISAKGATKSAGTIVAIAIALYLLAGAIMLYNSIDWSTMGTGILAVCVALGALTIAVAAINKAAKGSSGSAKTILAVAGAVLILSLAVEIFGHMDSNTLLKGGLAVAACLFAISIAVKTINNSSKGAKDSSKQMIVLSIAIGILAIAIGILGTMPTENIIKGTGAICVAMLAFGAALGIIEAASENAGKTLGGIVAFTVAVAVLAAGMYFLAQCDPNAVSTAANAISEAMLIFAVSMGIVAQAGSISLSAVPGILAMAAAVGIISYSLYELAQCDPAGLSAAMEALSGALIVFAGAMAIISQVGEVSIEGSVGILAMAVAVGVIALALDTLAQLDPTSLADATVALAGALVVFAAALILVAQVGEVSIEGAIGILAMAVAVVAIAVALTLLSAIDPNSLAIALLGLAAGMVILVLAAAGLAIVGTIASGCAIGLLALGIAALGIGAGIYLAASGIAALCSVDAGTLMAVGVAVASAGAAMLVGAPGIILFGIGALAAGAGIMMMASCSGQMGAIASGLNQMAGIDAGGLAIVGAALVVFGLGAIPAGAGLLMMSAAAPGLPAVATGIAALNQIDGVALGITGAALLVAAPGLLAFGAASLIAGVGCMLLGASAPMMPLIATGLQQISEVDGGALASTGDALNNLGNGALVAGAALIMLSVGLIAANTASVFLPTLVTDLTNLATLGYNSGTYENLGTSLTTLGTGMTMLGMGASMAGPSLMSFNMALSMVDGEVASASGAMAYLMASLSMLSAMLAMTTSQLYMTGAAAVSGLAGGISSAAPAVVGSMLSITVSITAAAMTLPVVLMVAGVSAAMALASGISSGGGAVGGAASGLANTAANAVRSAAGEFSSAGAYAAEGFANGIRNGEGSASIAAYAMGRAALDAAKQAIDSHSPSKEFFKLGMYADEGMAIGLEKYSYVAEDASASMGEATLSAISGLSSKLSGSIDPGEISPTITPVLDLSQVQNESSAISGMFANQQVAATYSEDQIGAISATADQTAQTQFELNNSIGSLSSRLDDIGNKISSFEENLPGYISENAPGLTIGADDMLPITVSNMNTLRINSRM